VDLLQVWSLNRYSGLVAVSSGAHAGQLHFADGEIVHAEAPGAEGEAAVRAILSWTDTSFEPFPSTSTPKRTIHKRLSHLLLDAHRELDEARRGTPAEAPPVPRAPAPSGPSVLDRIRAIRGVTRLVRFGADGRPAGPPDPENEALAARGLYLALTHAGAMARAFGLRELALASLESPRESFVVAHGGGQYLCVAVAPGTPVEPIVTQVRALLTRPAPR
jgi:hypothetical protein